MDVWKHLFLDGEFAPRAHILGGLTLEQVSARPAGAPHSIYEELWHVREWQRLVLKRDEAAYGRWQEGGKFPPDAAPEDEGVWATLVDKFLEDSARAVRFAEDEARLDERPTHGFSDDGFTWRQELEAVAVHNAYHLGKIVLLQQLLGIWSPPSKDAQPQ